MGGAEGGGREDGKGRSGDSEQKIMFSRSVNYTHVRVNLRNHPCDNCLTGNKCHGELRCLPCCAK